jgi:hypothetical protein
MISDSGIWHHETLGWLAEELQRADESGERVVCC